MNREKQRIQKGRRRKTMQQSLLQFKPPKSLLLKNQSFSQFNNGRRHLSLSNSISLEWKIRTSHFCGRSSDLFNLNLRSVFPLQGTQKGNLITAARRKSRRRTGWRRSGKSALESALLIASNLKLIPEPMNLIIREGLGGNGNGGGFGSWNGFGGGWFDGWGGGNNNNNNRKRNLGFLRILLGVCALVLLIYRKEFKGFSDLGIGVLGLLLLGTANKDWIRGIKGWILGFCSCASTMSLMGLRREELQKLVQRSRICSPFIKEISRSEEELQKWVRNCSFEEILRREDELLKWVQGFKVRNPLMEFFNKRRRRRRAF